MFDARKDPVLWAGTQQLRLHKALSELCPHATAIDISEIVLELGERSFKIYRNPTPAADPPSPRRRAAAWSDEEDDREEELLGEFAAFCSAAVQPLLQVAGVGAGNQPAALPAAVLAPLRALAARCKYLEGRQQTALAQSAAAATPPRKRKGANLGHSTPATAVAAVTAKARAEVAHTATDGALGAAPSNSAADGVAAAAARGVVLAAVRATSGANVAEPNSEAGGVAEPGAARSSRRRPGSKSPAELAALAARRTQRAAFGVKAHALQHAARARAATAAAAVATATATATAQAAARALGARMAARGAVRRVAQPAPTYGCTRLRSGTSKRQRDDEGA
jgi:hypothetical protein